MADGRLTKSQCELIWIRRLKRACRTGGTQAVGKTYLCVIIQSFERT